MFISEYLNRAPRRNYYTIDDLVLAEEMPAGSARARRFYRNKQARLDQHEAEQKERPMKALPLAED